MKGSADDRARPTIAFHDECGVFGIFGKPDAAAFVALGLHALQHRGQDAAGIVAFDGTQFHVERHVGLIGDNFTKPSVIARLAGDRAIGHTRYSDDRRRRPAQRPAVFAELESAVSPSPTMATSPTRMTVQRELQRAARSSRRPRTRKPPAPDRRQPEKRISCRSSSMPCRGSRAPIRFVAPVRKR
jgi:glutamate synthase domain-containing protein 1